MRFLHLTLLVLLTLIFACGEKDATAFDPAGQEWEFSLSNPVPFVENAIVPDNTPLSGLLQHELLSPGDVLQVRGDTVFVENMLKASFTGLPQAYRLFTDDYQPDSLAGFKLSQGVGTTLNAAFYKGDTLQGEWLFEEKKTRLREVGYGELSGQTYRCAFPGGDTMQVHFGTRMNLYGRGKGKEVEYFVEELPGFGEERSYIKSNSSSSWGFRMMEMRSNDFNFSFGRRAYGAKQYIYGRDERGTLFASYVEVENKRYEMIDVPMVLLPALKPSTSAEADFADRINSGKVIADDTYPRVDSAKVSYNYQKDYRGIEFDELSELEFSAEPGGEFIVVVRDRLLMNHKWKLSPDNRYLITLDKKTGSKLGHYPILAYTDEYIDLRMPFTVKTREPRGVALESHASIDVFIRIARRADATSR